MDPNILFSFFRQCYYPHAGAAHAGAGEAAADRSQGSQSDTFKKEKIKIIRKFFLVLVLLPATVERVSVSRMQDFCYITSKIVFTKCVSWHREGLLKIQIWGTALIGKYSGCV